MFLSNVYKKANNIPGYAIGIMKYHEHLTLTTRASIGANKYKGLLKLFSSAYIDVLTEKTTKTNPIFGSGSTTLQKQYLTAKSKKN